MTFEEAFKELKALFPKEYVTLRYEKAAYSDGREGRPSIGAYSEKKGWSNAVTFRGAITDLCAKEDEAGVDDGAI